MTHPADYVLQMLHFIIYNGYIHKKEITQRNQYQWKNLKSNANLSRLIDILCK